MTWTLLCCPTTWNHEFDLQNKKKKWKKILKIKIYKNYFTGKILKKIASITNYKIPLLLRFQVQLQVSWLFSFKEKKKKEKFSTNFLVECSIFFIFNYYSVAFAI